MTDSLGEFVLWNDSAEQTTLTFRVRDGADELLAVRHTLSPEDVAEVQNPIETVGTYTVVADVRDGPTSEFRWAVESCHEVTYVQVRIESGASLELTEKQRTVAPTPACGGTVTETNSMTPDSEYAFH